MTVRDLAASAPVLPGRARGLIMVAEHEPEVAEMTRRYLERARMPAIITESPAEAIALLRSRYAAGYVLDLTMPGLDIRLVRRALAAGPATSAVFLLGARAARPRGLGTGPGARRWLVRPFSPRALVEVLREMLIPPPRPAADPADPAVQAVQADPADPRPDPGPDPGSGLSLLELDPARRTVAVGSREVTLTPGEFAVLAALAGANGRVVTRDQLVAALRPGRGKMPGPRVVDVYITQLRVKLGTGAIRTVRSSGYALSDHIPTGSWQGKPKANSRGAAPDRSPDGASIA